MIKYLIKTAKSYSAYVVLAYFFFLIKKSNQKIKAAEKKLKI